MGVSGSGKSTVGAALAQRLRVPFADADDFHPEANVAKTAAGHALNDEDRYPWLEIIGEWLVALLLRRREMGMVARGRTDPRLSSRHRQPNHQPGAVAQAPRRLRTGCGNTARHPPKPQPFSTRHRIITVQGDTRDIVVIGERLHDNSGEVIGTQGFYIDVTRSDEAREATISEAVAEFAEHRAAIEQAKGVLMYIYRIDSAAAFDLLKWRSQETNVKLRVLAEQLLSDVRALEYDENPPPVQRSTGYSSQRTNTSEPRQLATDLNPQCGGVVQRPAWTPRNLAVTAAAAGIRSTGCGAPCAPDTRC